MQTQLADSFRDTPEGREADAILRRCVHCGFCTATCPTYQLLGDELDGPRGRIYLIKQVLEGARPTASTQLHLDRCLTCRACETTCPSGVEYARLLDIGRAEVARQVARPLVERVTRAALGEIVPRPAVFGPLVQAARLVEGVLPAHLRAKLPAAAAPAGVWPRRDRPRRMLALAGCAQSVLAPGINAATARVLDRLGIELAEAPAAGCCGAVRFHLNDQEGGRQAARRNIDAWWPHIEAGAEALVMTASGCGVFVRDYGHLLRDDPAYKDKAERVSALTRDVSEVVAAEAAALKAALGEVAPGVAGSLAFHAPCTLQHGLKIRGVVEALLTAAGYQLTPVADAHLCCGSAGTYALLQPDIALQLREAKLRHLCAGTPSAIATANVGCLTHLQAGTELEVRHWVELLDRRLTLAAG